MLIQAGIAYCVRGHAYTPENTKWRNGGTKRECRQCARDYGKRRRESGRGAVADRKWRQEQASVAVAAARGEVDLDDAPWATEDSLANLYGAMVRVAIADYRSGYHGYRMPDARDFLVRAGIVDPETGLIDPHGHRMPGPKVKRRSPRKATL